MAKSDPVGYGRPPKAHRFSKGKSGNPKGRPKGAKGLKTDLREELNSTIQVTVNGRPRTITKQRAAIKRLAADALGGNPRSLGLLLNLALMIEQAAELAPTAASDPQQDRALLERYFDLVRKTKRGGARHD